MILSTQALNQYVIELLMAAWVEPGDLVCASLICLDARALP